MQAPQTMMASGPLPDASVEYWKTDFVIPEAQEMRPPAECVGAVQLNHAASLKELMPRGRVSLVGVKAMHPLIKLQSFDGTGSLDTFLMKFQCMASYLHWDEENRFHQLCVSLEGRSGRTSPLGHRPSCHYSRHCPPASDQVRNPATR